MNDTRRQPIVVLLSGRGSNMRALAEASQAADAAFTVARVIADKSHAPGLRVAEELGIAVQALAVGKSDNREAYDRSLADLIDESAPAMIAMAGFMRILSAPFVQRFAGRMLNIHPSLLPKYAGLHTHRRALAAHDAEHGATVHFVTEQLDGGPRALQARININTDDTESTLSGRVLTQEHRIYPLAVSWYCNGRLRCRDGHAWLDGIALREPVQLTDTLIGASK